MVYRERISATDLESARFSDQLVERVGWAVSDAGTLGHNQERRRSVVRPELDQASSSQA